MQLFGVVVWRSSICKRGGYSTPADGDIALCGTGIAASKSKILHSLERMQFRTNAEQVIEPRMDLVPCPKNCIDKNL